MGEFLERVPGAKFGEPHADRRVRLRRPQRCPDLLKPAVCDRERAVAQGADEFVSADSDKRVIGAQVLLNGGSDVTQQRIAGAMTIAVVDLLEPVDIDVGENQTSVSVARAVDLTLEQQQPDLSTERAGQLIKLRASQISSPQPVIAVRAGAILDRCHTISGRVRTVSGTFGAVHEPLIGCRLVEVAVRDGLVSVNGGALSVPGRLIAVRGPLLSRRL
jgi:hypothetical protein